MQMTTTKIESTNSLSLPRQGEGGVSAADAGGLPSPPPKLTNALLRDLLDPTVSTLDLCDYHDLSLTQITTIINSESFKRAKADFEEINTARASLVESEAKFHAPAQLNNITKQLAENQAQSETIRKAASKLYSRPRNRKKAKPAQNQLPKTPLHQSPTPITFNADIQSIPSMSQNIAQRANPTMIKFITPLALIAAATTADIIQAPDPVAYTDPVTGQLLCGFTLDISGYNSNDFQGSAINETLQVFFGFNADVNAIAWDINLTTLGTSWASEATIGFEGQLDLIPANGDDFTVSNMNYSSNGVLHLSDFGLPSIQIGADGILDIEFFESGFDDNPGAADAIYEAGSTISVYTTGWPTPGTASTLAFAGLIASRRRR